MHVLLSLFLIGLVHIHLVLLPLVLNSLLYMMLQILFYHQLLIYLHLLQILLFLSRFLLVPIFGYIIICFASPLAWLLADAFLIPAFFYCQKHLLAEKARMD